MPGISRSSELGKGLQEKRSCASGTQLFRCDNGFTGCCSVDPGDADGGCPDEATAQESGTAFATNIDITAGIKAVFAVPIVATLLPALAAASHRPPAHLRTPRYLDQSAALRAVSPNENAANQPRLVEDSLSHK